MSFFLLKSMGDAAEILLKYGIKTSFIDYSDLACVKEEIRQNTKMLYIETPSNPLLKITDVLGVVKLAKQHHLYTTIDNTFMTALYDHPLDMGCDIVVESITKFISGHSDVVAGLVATNQEEIAKQLTLYQKSFGGILGVEDAWLVLRGMKTMGLRMEKSIKNAQSIAKFLEQHPAIKQVYYPELASHLGYNIHCKQASNGGAVLSFEFCSQRSAQSVIESLKLPIYAVSLGGVESILSHPATMSHACMSEEDRLKQGVTANLFRLSCGIEDTEDLLADFSQALDQ